MDTVTGKKTDQYSLATDSDLAETNSILFAGANSAAPIIAWADKAKKTFKFNILGEKKVLDYPVEAPAGEAVTEIQVHAPLRSNSILRFLVHYATANTHWAAIYDIDLTKKSVASVQNLPKVNGRAAYTPSQVDANLYFTKVTEREIIVISHTGKTLGRWPIESFNVPGLATGKELVYPLHATAEVAVRDGTATAVRAAVFLSTGDWVLIRNGEISWTRPEALAGAVAALWTEFDDARDLADQLEVESHSNVVSAYIHRVVRHIGDLQYLPKWLQTLPVRIAQGIIGKDSGADEKNTFGFGKRVIIATEDGRLVALDTGKAGNVIWNTKLTELDSSKAPFTLQLTQDPDTKNVRVRVQDMEQQILVDAASGASLGTAPISLPGDEADPKGTVTYLLVDGEVRGFLPQYSESPFWRFKPAKGEQVLSVTARPAEDPVASIGKVLGDRRVLYKYLNPNLALVTAIGATGASGSSASFYLLDTASGKLLHSQTHHFIDTSAPITAMISENWLAYSFTTAKLDGAPEAGPESHGSFLVVAELFESSIPNDRGPLGAVANYSSLNLPEDVKPYVESQTYQIPEEISSMAVTHTQQGITTRALLAVVPDANGIVSIPRMLIDPRRPVGREPTTDEQTEGLVKYVPVIEFDPKWYINHKREVFGVKKVIASPAVLESTSLVLAFGLDVFGTRVTPSFAFDVLGKEFNKLQMLATVAALWGGVLFVAPLVSLIPSFDLSPFGFSGFLALRLVYATG